jgi:hypothetical protein
MPASTPLKHALAPPAQPQTPSYRVEPDPSGSKDTCILVFTAGPPYEDIAFRIVNKEWCASGGLGAWGGGGRRGAAGVCV